MGRVVNKDLYNAWLESKEEPSEAFIQEALKLAEKCYDLYTKDMTIDEFDRNGILAYVVETILKFRHKYQDKEGNGKAIWGYFYIIAKSATVRALY